ncbi:MAG: acyl-CoA dehydrogenase [bacterium]|nr:acyl-CoA dehydrogenase [bacterium]
MAEGNNSDLIRGCSFLVEEHPLDMVFIPEEFSQEEKMIGDLVLKFVEGSVLPKLDGLEALEDGVMPGLLKEAGMQGLLAVDVPEQYGGMALSKAVGMLVAEKLGASGSFQVGHGAHTGIGTLPIVYFGTPEQKEKYLPKLAMGEWLGAYALTEAGSGSDAVAARAKAILSEDGTHYVLNGEKMFITNAGFADIFIVFAQVDGDKFTTFIMDKDMEGLSVGPEEKKLGIKGSSTRTLIMEDVKVPVENLLGRIGRGAAIAFNILNVGRFKLGAGAVGAAELCVMESVKYGKGRQQFKRPITDFGMIKHKIAEGAARVYAGRSMVYRTAGYIDRNIGRLDKSDEAYDNKMIDVGIREYMTECSMMKVFCSEALDYCADECVQIHGGYGYTQEYPAERFYRDSRINRIFEGTNEINRFIISGDVLKKAAKNQLPIFARAKEVVDELTSPPALDTGEAGDGFLAPEQKFIAQAKKTVLLALGTVAQEMGEKLKAPMDHEEVIALLSDMIMDVYAMESSVLRALKLQQRDDAVAAEMAGDLTRIYCNDAMNRLEIRGRETLAAVCEGDMLTTSLAGLRRVVKHTPINTVALRRKVADMLVDREIWPL